MDAEKNIDNLLICDGCQKAFTLGDQIFIFRLWIVRKDFCVECRDKIIDFLSSLSPQNKLGDYSSL